LWAIGMVVALLTTALLIINLYPEIWKGLLEERNLMLIAIGVSVTAIIVLLAIGGAASRWTGFRGMTVREWLDLLVVPLALVVISFVFTTQQDQRQQRTENQRAEAERELAVQRAQDEALQAYLDQMSTLMLERNLLESEVGDPVYTLAQARTSTIMTTLDAEGNRKVTRFLTDVGLTGTGESSISLLKEIELEHAELRVANLTGANLREADLSRADLSLANMVGANLSLAVLVEADLSEINMLRGDLSGSTLYGADLSRAYVASGDLSYTELVKADLSGANIKRANLSNASLQGANLTDADLTNANLTGAEGITNEELEQQAASLEGATMPNSQKYEDWHKDREKRQQDE
jgi:uncharacterized protein YjbI with pentapeptide repeats